MVTGLAGAAVAGAAVAGAGAWVAGAGAWVAGAGAASLGASLLFYLLVYALANLARPLTAVCAFRTRSKDEAT